MTHLPNAPLVYTLGLVRFPPVPNFERFIPVFHDSIRKQMPHADNIELRQVRVDFGSEGAKVSDLPVPVWQFSTPDRTWAVVLTQESLVVHTNSYRDHKDFIKIISEALEALINVPDIGIEWVTGIAVRYVDLVVPRKGESLSSFLQSSVLPPVFSKVQELQIVEGVYVAQYKSPNANVRLSILRNPATAIPPDLNTPLIANNGWLIDRPSSEFAVVDTDCTSLILAPMRLDIPNICEHVFQLRSIAKLIFENIGTEHAIAVWKGEA